MKRLFRAVLLVMAFVLSQAIAWVLCVVAVYAVGIWRSTTPVGAEVPETFPVLVVFKDPEATEATAAIVWHPGLASFRAAHPGASFLVSPAEEDRLREHVGRHAAEGQVRGTFSVKRAEGTQSIRIDTFEGGDLVTAAWYEARQDSVVPLRHRRYFGPGLGLAAVLAAIPLSLLFNGAAWFAAWKRRQRRLAPPLAADRILA